MSNSKRVLESLPPSEISPKLTFELDSSNVERALGILWDINSDLLMFSPNFKEVDASKRGMLKITASIFDPPGYVAPFVLKPKLLIQEAWRLGSDWDADLDSDMETQWDKWLKNAENLKCVRIQRCYYLGDSTIIETQLHIFSDASELAFGCVAYLRLSLKDQTHVVVMIMSKSRLAPLKVKPLPRLELDGAVHGARLKRFLAHEMDLPI